MLPSNGCELTKLQLQAESLARGRRERATTAHLLAAMAGGDDQASGLLRDRHLDLESLLRAARASTDDAPDALLEATRRARAVAVRMRAPDAGSLHLLVALLSEPTCGAYRALDQCGIDVSRLRVQAFNAALRCLGRQSIVTRREQTAHRMKRAGPGRAVSVPVMPSAGSGPRPSTRPRQTRVAALPSPPIPSGPGAAGPVEAQPAVSLSPSREPSTLARKLHKGARERRFRLDPKRFPLLTALGSNWSLQALEHGHSPVVGRDEEVEHVLDVLGKMRGNNPCLIGPPGVGKSSVIRALALRAREATPAQSNEDKLVVELSLPKLLLGTTMRGQLAERLRNLAREAKQLAPRLVLVLENLQDWFGPEGSEELTAELKLMLSSSQLSAVTTATGDQWQRVIESEPSLAGVFAAIDVEPPDREQAFLMLAALAPGLVRHHDVDFPEEILARAVAWSNRYLPSRVLPEKGVSLLDLAGARARRRGARLVSQELLAEVVSEQAGVPMTRLLESDAERLLNLEQLCAQRLVGHADKLCRIASMIRRNAAGLSGKKPIGTFLLLGPTGVGKTETAKALAHALFDSEDALTRVDMSEYSEAHAVARLIGAPPGYVGHEQGGQLTEAVRRRPYQVLLLDEIEKAHPDVLLTFLAVFDEGRLTDGRGRLVDFTNTVIVLTSNLGSREFAHSGARLGFGQRHSGERASADAQQLTERVLAAAQRVLPPEWYNRADEVLVYSPLSREQARAIAVLMLEQLGVRLRDTRRIGLTVDAEAIDLLLDRGGFSVELGARPIKRMIARHVESAIAQCVLLGEVKAGDTLRVRVTEGQLAVEVDAGSLPTVSSSC